MNRLEIYADPRGFLHEHVEGFWSAATSLNEESDFITWHLNKSAASFLPHAHIEIEHVTVSERSTECPK